MGGTCGSAAAGVWRCWHFLLIWLFPMFTLFNLAKMILCTWVWNAVQFFFFLMLSLDVQENQKMMSVDTVWFWSSFEVTWGMCLKQEDDFSKGRDERGSLFYFKIKCEACVCCNKLFAQVNANGHILYVRTKKKKKTWKTKKMLELSRRPLAVYCVSSLIFSLILCQFILFNGL